MMEIFGYNTFKNVRCIDSYHSGEQYGDWHSEHTTEIYPRACKSLHPDVNSFHDFAPGDLAYLVTAIWSSGDSFGNSRGGDNDDIWLFKNPKSAFKFVQFLEKADKGFEYVDAEEGGTISLSYLPWCGYFENLDEVVLTMVMIEPNYKEL